MGNDLDQFYTKKKVAVRCWREVKPVLRELTGTSKSNIHFIEPSAGSGIFYELLPEQNRFGLDIEPKCSGVRKGNFLTSRYQPPLDPKRVVVIGNPPFGKRGKTALEFINKAFTMADTVAFILPVIFRKYTMHQHIKEGASLVYVMPLGRDSFQTATGKNYIVNTEFQVWTMSNSMKDMRRFSHPPIKHPDFVMHQYNNTVAMSHVFDNSFDFAVPCQGWQDYDRREIDANKCERNKQWILFKSKDKRVRNRLYNIDYDALALRCSTTVPGFRKGDIVEEYNARYGKQCLM